MKKLVPCLLATSLVACGSPENSNDGENLLQAPNSYAFVSRFDEESSIQYNGQIFRQVMIADIKSYIAGLTDKVAAAKSGGTAVTETGVAADLKTMLTYDGTLEENNLLMGSGFVQATYGALGSTAIITEKVAGQDEVGQHKDFANAFRGFGSGFTPLSLVQDWVTKTAALAEARVSTDPVGPDGVEFAAPFVSEEGLDYQQLLNKFLLGSVAFSQAADDYLDDDEPNKGLLSDNTQAEEGKNYTALEHAWDEGLGYFGAARNYADYSDLQIRSGDSIEIESDGKVDLFTEKNFGYAVTAAKRDYASIDKAPVDFTGDIFNAFINGRTLIVNADGALSDAQMTELKGYRDTIVESWEKVIAGTVTHYIDETLQDMSRADTSDYNFLDHAKHWGEMKGYALSFQFNPRSGLSATQFDTLHALFQDAPVLPGDADFESYKSDLVTARNLLRDAYAFDEKNLGDQNGEGGW